MHRARLIGLAALGLACTEERPAPKNASAPPLATVVVAPEAKDAGARAVQLKDPNGLDGAPTNVAWLRDGTLVVTSDTQVLALDPHGRFHRAPTEGRYPKLAVGDSGESIALEGNTDIVLLGASLDVVWKGEGKSLTTPADGVAAKPRANASGEAVLFRGGKLLRFTMPAGKTKHPDTVDLVAGGKSALVTWTVEESGDREAALFEAATGRHLGKAFPMGLFNPRPVASVDAKYQYGVDDRKVVSVIDLETGAVVRSSKVACGKDSFLGNPMPSPSGDLLLVTCGSDGIGLDPKTFAVKRRYPSIMPGCDNGDILPASFDAAKPTELMLEGCGGEARLDLTTGKYRCSDDIGLVGAPYEVVLAPPTPGMPAVPQRRAPAGRENLPRCTQGAGSAPMYLDDAHTFAHRYDDGGGQYIEHPKGRITLEADAHAVVLSPDRARIAYSTKGRVIVRAVPAGDIVREITTR